MKTLPTAVEKPATAVLTISLEKGTTAWVLYDLVWTESNVIIEMEMSEYRVLLECLQVYDGNLKWIVRRKVNIFEQNQWMQLYL